MFMNDKVWSHFYISDPISFFFNLQWAKVHFFLDKNPELKM